MATRLKSAARKALATMSSRRARTIQERYPQYEIGRHTYGSPTVRGGADGSKLQIGSFCSIAEGVRIYLLPDHRTDWVTTFPFSALWPEGRGIPGHPRSRGDVVIGNDVWIGAGVTLLSGCRIGDGAVVGAGAVVVGEVPPYAIAAGNPARVIRHRFDPDLVQRLLAVQWWDWSDERVAVNLPALLDSDLEAFLAAAESAG